MIFEKCLLLSRYLSGHHLLNGKKVVFVVDTHKPQFVKLSTETRTLQILEFQIIRREKSSEHHGVHGHLRPPGGGRGYLEASVPGWIALIPRCNPNSYEEMISTKTIEL